MGATELINVNTMLEKSSEISNPLFAEFAWTAWVVIGLIVFIGLIGFLPYLFSAFFHKIFDSKEEYWNYQHGYDPYEDDRKTIPFGGLFKMKK